MYKSESWTLLEKRRGRINAMELEMRFVRRVGSKWRRDAAQDWTHRPTRQNSGRKWFGHMCAVYNGGTNYKKEYLKQKCKERTKKNIDRILKEDA